MTRAAFASRFAPRAVFGMVHLRALPGAPLFSGSLSAVIEAALVDARALAEGGVDGIVFENFGDRPFFATRVPASTVAFMTRAIAEVVREVRLPFGVNVLRNDASSAVAIAAATGAAFVRINVHTGAMLTDQGIIEGEAAATLRLRASLAPEVAIFADHFVKHAVPLAPVDAVQTAKDLRLRGLADALIISGTETGSAPEAARLSLLRAAMPDAPLLLGSGLTPRNAEAFGEADGAIVGTSVKEGGDIERPVEAARVAAVVTAFKASGGR
ncbi:MAG TPA: BtpA/SgcQ family protein [Thermoanaerobaculia bacterium]|nr:BtpA/SgcQ family protein [Thermoanaerobaculia bacterium]